MDDRTGKIYEFPSKDVMEQFMEQFEQVGHSMTELEKGPDTNCPICGGSGSRKSKPYTKDGHICFYRPCRCTRCEQ